MEDEPSVQRCLNGVAEGDPAAAEELWNYCFPQLVRFARHKLRGRLRRAADEEDVALDAMDSFCRAVREGRFAELAGRNELLRLLLQMTARKAADEPSLLIDDFGRRMIDWYVLNAGNPHHWQYWTRKITDPKWRDPHGAALRIDLVVPQNNTLVVVAEENEWRRYRGRRRTYVARKQLAGSGQARSVMLGLDDFECPDDGAKLKRWDHLDQLGLCPYCDVEARGSESSTRIGGDRWAGEPPRLVRLEWAMPPAETKADNE